MAAQIKLIEVWKSVHVEGNPTKLDLFNKTNQSDLAQVLRRKTNRVFNDISRLEISKSSFHIDAARLWNRAPAEIQIAPTLSLAKKAVLRHVKSLPI